MNLRNNTILITGGGSGIGRGLAEAFYKLGNQVIIAGRRREVLDQTVAANPGMASVVLDATKPESIRRGVGEISRKFPDLNVLINNAGVQRLQDFANDAELNETAVREEIDTNIYGVLRMTAALLPHFKSKAAATIINVSSGLAFLPLARYPIYCATKAFVHSFSMSLRQQLKNTPVRVIELAPPWVATDLGSNHTSATAHRGMSPMPLPAFIEAAMQELASDAEELPVAGAKFLYSGGISERSAAVFEQINQ